MVPGEAEARLAPPGQLPTPCCRWGWRSPTAGRGEPGARAGPAAFRPLETSPTLRGEGGTIWLAPPRWLAAVRPFAVGAPAAAARSRPTARESVHVSLLLHAPGAQHEAAAAERSSNNSNQSTGERGTFATSSRVPTRHTAPHWTYIHIRRHNMVSDRLLAARGTIWVSLVPRGDSGRCRHVWFLAPSASYADGAWCTMKAPPKRPLRSNAHRRRTWSCHHGHGIGAGPDRAGTASAGVSALMLRWVHGLHRTAAGVLRFSGRQRGCDAGHAGPNAHPVRCTRRWDPPVRERRLRAVTAVHLGAVVRSRVVVPLPASRRARTHAAAARGVTPATVAPGVPLAAAAAAAAAVGWAAAAAGACATVADGTHRNPRCGGAL